MRRRRQLHRAEQLLALAVEPDDQRHEPDSAATTGRVLGRVAGRADAPRQRQRRQPTLMDYCTAGRRSPAAASSPTRSSPAHGDQRLAAAVLRPQQRARRLVQRRLEPGVLRRPGAPAQCFPADSDAAAPTRRWPTSPVDARESRTCTSTRAGTYRVFVPGAQHDSGRHDLGERPDRRHARFRSSDFFVASPATPAQTINNELARGKNLLLTPGVYNVDRPIEVKRADTVVLGLGFADARCRTNGERGDDVADVAGRRHRRADLRRRPGQLAVLLQIGTRRHAAHGGNARTTRRRCRTCSSASAAPHAGKAR